MDNKSTLQFEETFAMISSSEEMHEQSLFQTPNNVMKTHLGFMIQLNIV